MTQEQRQFILDTIEELECDRDNDVVCGLSWPEIQTLIDFARQQLNLRVDGEKLRDQAWERWAMNINPYDVPLLESLVMECLTTEEKE
jgi:hypothetical protein